MKQRKNFALFLAAAMIMTATSYAVDSSQQVPVELRDLVESVQISEGKIFKLDDSIHGQRVESNLSLESSYSSDTKVSFEIIETYKIEDFEDSPSDEDISKTADISEFLDSAEISTESKAVTSALPDLVVSSLDLEAYVSQPLPIQ